MSKRQRWAGLLARDGEGDSFRGSGKAGIPVSVCHVWTGFCLVLLPPSLFLLSEFSLLSLSPRLQFFSCPFFFSPSLFCLSALGFSGLPSSRKPVSWAHWEPMVPERLPLCGCLPLKDLVPVSSVLAFLSVEFKDIVALETSCLNPFAVSLSPG